MSSGVWLVESKTKGDIDERKIARQCRCDLQSMLYLVALTECQRRGGDGSGYASTDEASYHLLNTPVAGVRFNVVRRPLSGGKGTIVQHKPTKSNPAGETREDYLARLEAVIRENADTFFMRFNVTVSPKDVARFRREALDPILEQLCDWWEWAKRCDRQKASPFDTYQEGSAAGGAVHWKQPFGLRNLDDYGSEVDGYCETGSEVGLRRVDRLFTELD